MHAYRNVNLLLALIAIIIMGTLSYGQEMVQLRGQRKIFYSSPEENQSIVAAVLANVDEDEDIEFIFYGGSIWDRYISISKWDGETFREFWRSEPFDFSISFSGLTAGNIDSDPESEIIVFGYPSKHGEKDGLKIFDWANGEYKEYGYTDISGKAVTTGDFNGDGVGELVVAELPDYFNPNRGDTEGYDRVNLLIYDWHEGTVKQTGKIERGDAFLFLKSGDIDNDGTDEIITGENIKYPKGGPKDGILSELNIFKYNSVEGMFEKRRFPIIKFRGDWHKKYSDIDNIEYIYDSGIPTIYVKSKWGKSVGIKLFRYEDERLVERFDSSYLLEAKFRRPKLLDIDGDGKNELVDFYYGKKGIKGLIVYDVY